jgi:leader peptidase (prepilin peptidase)/N-methyltransferase
MMVPTWFWCITTFLFGITIGSFLNVVIYRLPIGGSLVKPEYSYCPNCDTRLKAVDLVPLFSFLLLGRKCRRCKQPISWRYFLVELLTGLLFVAIYLRYPQNAANCVGLLLFAAVLIPIFFIDLATYHIETSLNLFAFCVAIGRDVWGIATHEPGHELMWGWLPRSILGAVVGVLIFGAVRVLGWLWKKQEAMGLGDVLLARAMGAMLVSVTLPAFNPFRLFPAWVLFACFSGVLIGYPMLLMGQRGASGESETQEVQEPEEAGDGSSLGKELYEIGECLWLGDAVLYLQCLFHPERLKQSQAGNGAVVLPVDEEDFQPAPTAIPFGPFMVLGFFLAVFCGEPLTAWYLAYALPKRGIEG